LELGGNEREVRDSFVFGIGKNYGRAREQAADRNRKTADMIQRKLEQPPASRLQRKSMRRSLGIGDVGSEVVENNAGMTARAGGVEERASGK
jgi:hypothetical protein